MLKKLNELKNKQKGFTIIEVLIVLAIAALIMVIVLIAIPQLQRNQRNTARRATASRIAAEIGNFIGNNNGVPPAATFTGALAAGDFGNPKSSTGFFGRYLGCTTSTVASGGPPVVAGGAASCTTDINDPTTAAPMGTGTGGLNVNVIPCTTAGVPATVPGTTPGDMCYATNMLCNGESVTTTGASVRTYAFAVRVEGGSVACFDNG